MNAELTTFAEVTPTTSRTIVLAIEDEVAREALADELAHAGYHVIEVEDGYELFDCLELFLRVAKPVAIVAACALSGRSGLELCSALANRPNAPPVVLIAASDDESTWAQASRSGADFVIDQPAGLIELFDLLDLTSEERKIIQHS